MKVRMIRDIGEVIEKLEIEDIDLESPVTIIELVIDKYNRESEMGKEIE